MTKLLYLTDSYRQNLVTEVASVAKYGDLTALILKDTIFYPEGGGQPSDQGEIKSLNGTLKVTQVTFNSGNPLHRGQLTGTIKAGDKVTCTIDWGRRYHNMQVHSAGHVVHEAVRDLIPEVQPLEGDHGKHPSITYRGTIDQHKKNSIEEKSNEIISDNLQIVSKLVSRDELVKFLTVVPADLPTNKQLRVIKIDDFPYIHDGGTQVAKTGEIPHITITSIDYDDVGNSIVRYEITQATSKKERPETNAQESLIPEFEKIKEESLLEIFQSGNTGKTELTLLGKRGKLNATFQEVLKSGKYENSRVGKSFNLLKDIIIRAFEEKKHETSNKEETIDVTLPGIKPPQGHIHPVTSAIEEISSIFEKIGFTRVRYPEVEWDWYAFESLNMLPGHPARDEWETFFVEGSKSQKYGEMVLTPHTSNGQVREMERLKNPPIRMINIAKCYRRQSDVSHTPMFHQFEGLVVDKNITITHLKGTIDYFVRQFFGPNRRSRIRPFHFQFTEPSFEVDVTCDICLGKGCKLCKEGWLELGGAGMVHPAVLKNGGVDSNIYTGFAFGWGVERVYMMKAGVKIDDLRLLYCNDIRFLNQF
jgi:phenylalanyl-tRNA synthetase alpha chain